MENERRVNPELVKKCAEISGIRVQEIDGKIIVMRPEVYAFEHCNALEPWPKIIYDPMNSDTWQKALVLALMRQHGWSFGDASYEGLLWQAKREEVAICDESFPLLLLKCVSSQTGVPMYV